MRSLLHNSMEIIHFMRDDSTINRHMQRMSVDTNFCSENVTTQHMNKWEHYKCTMFWAKISCVINKLAGMFIRRPADPVETRALIVI